MYTATIRHYSVSRARVVEVGETLLQAKRNATRKFGDGFHDHTIVIYQPADIFGVASIAAERRIGSKRWQTYI